MRFFPALCGFVLTATCSDAVLAGAWTQPEGKGLAILNIWYYQANDTFNNSGQEVPQLRYQKDDINPYIEYGLTDAITLGTNLSLQHVNQKVSNGEWSNWGLGDSEFFARFKLWQQDNWIVSTEPLIKLPSPGSLIDQPPIGSDDPDAAIKLAVGYGFNAFGHHHYVSGDAQYRYRFGSPENQMRYELTAGIGVAKDWQVLPQLFITHRTKDPLVVGYTQTSADDYNLTKLQISAVYQFRDDIAFQVGAFSHVDGKNVGSGEGALFAVWKDF